MEGMPKTEPALSIVIPSHNGRRLLQRCLESVFLHRPADSEVIVVDDGSQDCTSSWLRATFRQVRLVQLSKNQGYCRAVNAGIQASRAPVVQTLNNDTIVTQGWTEPALRLFADPGVGSVAPQVWLLQEQSLLDSAGDLYYLFGWAANRGHGLPLQAEMMDERGVFGTCGSAGFFRREALFRAGLFPSHFQAYYDDVDLAFRLRWAGYRCIYTPFSKVYHLLHGTYNHRDPNVTYLCARNEERVFWSNVPARSLWRAVAPHLSYILAMVVGKALLGTNSGAYLKGKLAVLGDAKEIYRQRQQRRLLARQANFPIQFPFEDEPWMLVKLLFSRLRDCLSPGPQPQKHSAIGPEDYPELLADNTGFSKAA